MRKRPTIGQFRKLISECLLRGDMHPYDADEFHRILDAQATDKDGRCVLPGDQVVEKDGVVGVVEPVGMSEEQRWLIVRVSTGDRYRCAVWNNSHCTLIESEGEHGE